jgi:hypothetical protein
MYLWKDESYMSQLSTPRRGWENENLAAYLLSSVAFISHPVSVADDVGVDFACTLFETDQAMLVPRSTFVIQVKSSRKTVNVSKHLPYLFKLEVPYFVGVIERDPARLTIFSGEYLPIFLTQVDPVNLELRLELVDTYPEPHDYFGMDNKGVYTVKLPIVATLDINMGESRLKAPALIELCSKIHANIARKTAGDYVFTTHDPNNVLVMSGPASAQTFRDNFYWRLAEVFENLRWLRQNVRADFNAAEFEIYSGIYDSLVNAKIRLPATLHTLYNSCKKVMTAS